MTTRTIPTPGAPVWEPPPVRAATALEALVLDLRATVAGLEARLDRIGEEVVTRHLRVVGDRSVGREPGDGVPYIDLRAASCARIEMGSGETNPSVHIGVYDDCADLRVRTRDHDNAPQVELVAYGNDRSDSHAQIRVRLNDQDTIVAETEVGVEKAEWWGTTLAVEEVAK